MIYTLKSSHTDKQTLTETNWELSLSHDSVSVTNNIDTESSANQALGDAIDEQFGTRIDRKYNSANDCRSSNVSANVEAG